MGKKMIRISLSEFTMLLNGRCKLVNNLPSDAKIIDARFDGFTAHVEILAESSEFMPGSHVDPNPLYDATMEYR